MTLAKAMAWSVPVLALLMLGLTLTPAEVWHAPAIDAVYRGFDANLVYTNDGGGGSVQVSPDSLGIAATSSSNPSANLATTLLQKLEARLDVTVTANDQTGEPLRIGVWSPWAGDGYLFVFGPAPQNLVTVRSIANGASGPSLTQGRIVQSNALGSYLLGSTYHLVIKLDRAAGITYSVLGDGLDATASLLSSQAPRMFENVQLSVTASAAGGAGTSRVVLQNFSLTLPHQRWWASKVDDPVARALLVLLAVMGALAVLLVIGVTAGAAKQAAGRIRSGFADPVRAFARPGVLVLVAVAVAAYVVGNALLFPLGGHPFDMGDQKLYAYVASAYGPAQLYFLPNTVSLAKIFNGVPYLESAFPYEPVSAYLSTATGWLTALVTGGAFRLEDVRLEYVIKALNVLFGLADGVVIYAILRQLAVSARWSWIAAGLFVFNPATWFSMSVWGQTHVFSLFLVLLAVLLAENRWALWAWLALAAACLTRPQMVVFGLLLGIVFLRKFSWSDNLSALSWTVVVVFLALVPFTLATSPSLPVDIMLNNFHVQEAGGNAAALTTVSQDAYSVWPLVTYIAHGATGVARAFTPSSAVLVGSLTYQRLSQVLTVAALLAVAAALLLRRRVTTEPGGYLPLVALGIASFLMLLTGIVATHFLLALPFLLLCRRWMGSAAYFYVAAIWTVTTFVPMYGDMGVAISTSHSYPLLAPANNAATLFFVRLYSWDRFITVSVVANICAVLWLAWLITRRVGAAAPARSTA